MGQEKDAARLEKAAPGLKEDASKPAEATPGLKEDASKPAEATPGLKTFVQEPENDAPKPETTAPEAQTGMPRPHKTGAPESEDGGIRISTDAMIALVVTEAEERERAGLPSLREMNEAFRPSEAFEKKMEKLRRTVKNRQRLRRWLRAAKRTVVCLTVLVTLLTCAMIPAKAVQEAIVETWFEWHDQFTSIVFSPEEARERLLPEKIELAYIPAGFELQEPVLQNSCLFYAEYTDGDDWVTIHISKLENDEIVALDNEYTSFYTVRFQDHDAIWADHGGGLNTLVWSDPYFLYYVTGAVDLRELIQIAENIKL